MSETTRAVLLGLFTLASGIWIGGYVAIGAVASAASATLAPDARVSFFRALGRRYLWIGGVALAVALGTGAALLSERAWDGTLTAALAVAVALVLALAVGVVQARRMTRLRRAALADPADQRLARQVERGARGATVLRAAIGVFSLALIALGALLAS